jgi:predicted DNA-binding transcriptional regulator AlpA
MGANNLVAGYRFADLKNARIVSSRSDLDRKQREHGFPKPIKLSARAAWWPACEVNAWLRKRIALRDKNLQGERRSSAAARTRARGRCRARSTARDGED